MANDSNKFFPIDEIRLMWKDGILSKGDMMNLTIHNCNLFVELILNIPYHFSPNQEYLLDVFYDPANNYSELLWVSGRKSGKTDIASAITLFQVYRLLNVKPNPTKVFGIIKGKPVYAVNIGPSRDEALGVAFKTIKALVDGSWYFKQYKKDEKIGEILFPYNITIHCQGSSSRSVRGFGNIINLYDEQAWHINTQGNLSGDEIFEANQPNLDTLWVPNAQLSRTVCISSPAGKQGIFWENFRKGDPVRVIQPQPEHGEEPWRAVFQYSTWEANPQLPFKGDRMQQELKRNPDKFWMERGAKFCDVVNPAVLYDFVLQCAGGKIETGNRMIGKRAIDKKTMRIVAGDPGVTGDYYALAMGHMKNDVVVIDYIRYWKGDQSHPIDIEEIENDMRELHKRFYVRYFVLDKVQSISTIQRLRKEGIPIYQTPPKGIAATKYNSMAYEYTLDRINLQTIKLPWHATLLGEFQFLQRKVSGKSVRYEAAVGHTDDGTDCVARVVMTLEQFGRRRPHFGWETKK